MADHDIIAARRPFAREVTALTDRELETYLEENGRIVSVQDPENITRGFIQRLRTIAHNSREGTQSHAVDLDQVAARLQTLPVDTEPFSKSPSLVTTESLPSQEEQNLEDLRQEIESYPALVNAGGRPPYPFHLLETFFWHPEQYLEHDQYRDIILFWRERDLNAAERTAFCGCHLLRWTRFRRLQHIIREESVRSERTLINAVNWDSWEEFLEHSASTGWAGQWGFQDYFENLKARLSKYGFTQPFQLEHDLERQDKLTTWIEYLGYEYWFYDRAASFIERFQQRHDDAWKRLVDLNVLRPEETYDVICNIDTAFQYANARERAETAVKSATIAVLSTKTAIAKSHRSNAHLQKQLLADQATLNAAKEKHESIRTRNDAVTNFLQTIRQYRCEKDGAARHRLLLRWIVQQIPPIELELNSLNSAEDDPGIRGRGRRLKRVRSENIERRHSQAHTLAEGDDQVVSARRTRTQICDSLKRRQSSIDIDPPLKRVKGSPQECVTNDAAPDAFASALVERTPGTKTTQGLKVSNMSVRESFPSLKPVRRSARIAELAKTKGSVKRPNPPPLVAPEMPGRRTPVRRAKRSW